MERNKRKEREMVGIAVISGLESEYVESGVQYPRSISCFWMASIGSVHHNLHSGFPSSVPDQKSKSISESGLFGLVFPESSPHIQERL